MFDSIKRFCVINKTTKNLLLHFFIPFLHSFDYIYSVPCAFVGHEAELHLAYFLVYDLSHSVHDNSQDDLS